MKTSILGCPIARFDDRKNHGLMGKTFINGALAIPWRSCSSCTERPSGGGSPSMAPSMTFTVSKPPDRMWMILAPPKGGGSRNSGQNGESRNLGTENIRELLQSCDSTNGVNDTRSDFWEVILYRCVCVYLCMYVCMYVCIYIYIYMYVCMYVCTYVRM